MSAEHVRQSRLLALSARLQRRKDQLERDWLLVQQTHRCGAASLILEARSAVQKAEKIIESNEDLADWLECEECGSFYIAAFYEGKQCHICSKPLPARAKA